MSQPMTVERVVKENEWEGKFGKNQAYSLDLKMPDGRLEMGVTSNRKLKDDGTHNEPREGEELMGSIEPDGRGGEKLKIDYDATKELSQGAQFPSSESSTSNSSSPKQETDWEVRNAEIRRQHSQGEAVQVLAHMGSYVMGERTVPIDKLQGWIKEWADWFDQDAIAAGQKYGQEPIHGAGHQDVASASPAPGSAPVDFSGARTEEPGPDTHQWLEALLVVAGAPTYASQKLATYALEKLLPDQRKTLETELNDPDSSVKAAGLKRVEASYEKTEGHAVPQIDPSDDIPF